MRHRGLWPAVLLMLGMLTACSSPPPPEPAPSDPISVELPENYHARASSRDPDRPASQAVDANIFSSFASDAHPDPEHTEWLQLDLGWVRGGITGVQLYPSAGGAGFPTDFAIQLSRDAEHWQSVPGAAFRGYPNPGDALQSVGFAAQTARYVRLLATRLSRGDGEGYALQLAEMRVEQLPRHRYAAKAAVARAARPDAPAALLIDGQPGTVYASPATDNAQQQQWAQIDLGAVHPVNRVRVFPAPGGAGFPQDFRLEGSRNGADWAPLPGAQFVSYPNPGLQEQCFDLPVTELRYVRLVATRLGADGAGGYSLQLAELAAELLERAPGLTPIAVTGSSARSADYGPERAADLLPESEWASALHPRPEASEWLQLTFPRRYAVDALTLTPARGGVGFPQALFIEYSNDAKTWTPVLRRDDLPKPGPGPQTFHFAVTSAQLWRVVATRLGPDRNGFSFRLAEVQAESGAPFRSDLPGDFDRQWNAMYNEFGSVRDGTDAVYTFGNEPAYFEWMALKYLWAPDAERRQEFLQKVRDYPVDTDGYVWSWADRRYWPSGNVEHYDNNAKYVLAVGRIARWVGPEFLNASDAGGGPSHGQTVWQKVESATRYLLESMHGRDGLLIIPNPENDGTAHGAPSNYWDNLRFGYADASTNAYFQATLLALRDLFALHGDGAQAQAMAELAATARSRYNQLFWQADTGRYAGSVDATGHVWDFGLSFVNTEALTYGLAGAAQARQIYDWLDGYRIVRGDTSSGSDIYRYKLAPRSNTLAIDGAGWWMGPSFELMLDRGGAWDQHEENGGIIFYTAYYDLLARARLLSADAAWLRFGAILNEYRVDELRRKPKNTRGNSWKFGITDEFPESGLVPTAPVYAFLGIDAGVDSLNIEPNLPGAATWLQVQGLFYRGRSYDITVRHDGLEIDAGAGQGRLRLRVGHLRPGVAYRLLISSHDGGSRSEIQRKTDSAGSLTLDLELPAGSVVILQPRE